MGDDQLALRTNDRWLLEEKGPTTNEKGPTTDADFGWVIPVNFCFIQTQIDRKDNTLWRLLWQLRWSLMRKLEEI